MLTVCSSFGLDTSDYSFLYIAGWSSSREMKEMKASMDVIRKTAGEMIDQLTEELEIILEEKQKTELHDKYGILVDALEAAGYRYDYRESEPGYIVLAPDGTHEIAGYLQFVKFFISKIGWKIRLQKGRMFRKELIGLCTHLSMIIP